MWATTIFRERHTKKKRPIATTKPIRAPQKLMASRKRFWQRGMRRKIRGFEMRPYRVLGGESPAFGRGPA